MVTIVLLGNSVRQRTNEQEIRYNTTNAGKVPSIMSDGITPQDMVLNITFAREEYLEPEYPPFHWKVARYYET
jgi:hypothetical protein